MTETLLDASLVLAAWLVAAAVAGYAPRARAWGVAVVTTGVLVVAAVRDVFRAPWVLDSLAQDVPWGAVALLRGAGGPRRGALPSWLGSAPCTRGCCSPVWAACAWVLL